MEKVLRARISYAIWAVVAVAIPLLGFLSMFGLVEGIGWEKMLGVLVFLPFIFSMITVIGFGIILLSEDALEVRCFLGRYRVEWDEVERIWKDSSGLNWVVEGHGKRVAVPGPSLWKSPHKEEMVGIMRRKLEERGIKPQLDGGVKTFLLSNRASRISE